ncbi:galactose-1-phosphate uridylyltransferase [Limnochorda pilosa]|uniref:Galactose-1-phosphate uridylyltransferase n=1 Tax=Limnochorda pilosa TaxID=1555112 RepID=A0A0K2SNY6_LIMPI|nr:DUF4931 domain-containing protein [Limnochorda pilosa]BAS28816.1 galactose-1-phosphate uridylyltransferase [Limnochorda pilosa]
MPELREDPWTGRWVLIASERSQRPHDAPRQRPDPPRRGNCPFCPGHEGETPPEVFRAGADDLARLDASRKPSREPAGEAAWQVRVVPNRYPMVRSEMGPETLAWGGRARVPAFGVHEVIVDSPDHGSAFHQLSLEARRLVLAVVRQRLAVHYQDRRLEQVVLFKNWGREAGASLEHPHLQLIGLPWVPPRVRRELVRSGEHLRTGGGCLLCRIVEEELQEGARVVAADDAMVLLAPFASGSPYEVWLVPRLHRARFEATAPDERDALARWIGWLTGRVEGLLGPVAHNWVLHTAPRRGRGFLEGQELEAGYHWHVEFRPRVTVPAGFEWGAGVDVNVVAPEQAAEWLRA